MFRLTSISLGALVLAACGGGGGGDFNGNPPPPGTFTVGGSLSGLASNTSVVLQNNGGNNLTVSANGAFTFSTSLATGAAYSVSVLTQPTGQTCTVSSGSGTIASASVTNVAVLCTPQIGKFLYVPNVGSNNVSAYSINAATGALTAVAGSPFAADQAPSLGTADPAGKFLYVINQGSTSSPPRISSYAINATSGVLTQNLLSPFPVTNPPPPNGPTAFNKPIIHPSGQFGYVGNATTGSAASGTLYGASADANGTLTEIPGMPMFVGAGLGFGTFDAAGKFLYLPHNNFNFTQTGAVSVFQINTAAGTLQSLGQFATGGVGPTFATLTPPGKFLLVAQNFNGAGSVAVFAVDAVSGTLTPVAGSPFSTGGIAVVVTAHPTKNFVYANSTAGTASAIAGFQIDPNTGVLTPVAGSPFSTGGNGASFVRIDASGKFLYVANSTSNTIQGFTIDQTTGALTPVPGAPMAADTTPLVTLDPSGRYLYSTNSGANANTIVSYAINPTTGALTLVTRIATGTRPVAVEVVGRQ